MEREVEPMIRSSSCVNVSSSRRHVYLVLLALYFLSSPANPLSFSRPEDSSRRSSTRRGRRKLNNSLSESSNGRRQWPNDKNVNSKKKGRRFRKPKTFFTATRLAPPLQETPEPDILSPTVLERDHCQFHICGQLPITYTNDFQVTERWINHHLKSYDYVGFDVESMPNAPWIKSLSGLRRGPCTVQLSTPFAALVIQLTEWHSNGVCAVPPSLEKLLNDPAILKVGIDIDNDMLELYQYSGGKIDAKSRFDLGGVGSGPNRGRIGLKTLVRAVMGVEIIKTRKLSISNWSKVPLSTAQLDYCARDAWAGAAIFKEISKISDVLDTVLEWIPSRERPMRDMHDRATQRKLARVKIAEIVEQYPQYATTKKEKRLLLKYATNVTVTSSNWNDNSQHETMPQSLRNELDRLKQIVYDTAPDGLLILDAELLGLDFSFETKR